MFKVGDVVLGHSHKLKTCYDVQKAKIIAVLSTHYKVAMLEGDAAGQTHKYPRDKVTQIEVAPPPPTQPGEATAKPQPANNGDDVQAITQDIIELWGLTPRGGARRGAKRHDTVCTSWKRQVF